MVMTAMAMTALTVLFADVSANGAIFDADGAKIETLANTFIDIKSFGSTSIPFMIIDYEISLRELWAST